MLLYFVIRCSRSVFSKSSPKVLPDLTTATLVPLNADDLTEEDEEDLLQDRRFSDQRSRNEHFDHLFEVISDWTKRHDKIFVMEAFGNAGVPCGAVLDSGDILANEHLKKRGMITSVEHPTRGNFTMPGCAVQMSDSPADVRPAPLLGQNNHDILGSLLGLTSSDLDRLKDNGII